MDLAAFYSLDDPFADVRGLAPVVVSYGGGVNSFALLLGLQQRRVLVDAIVFSDTRGEKPETYEYLDRVVDPWCRTHGFPEVIRIHRSSLVRQRVPDQSLEDECRRLGLLPSRAYGYGKCADKWKIEPFNQWLARWEPAYGRTITCLIGYDADEAHRVANDIQDPGKQKVYPLIAWGWDRDACADVITSAGYPLPPKSACYYCPSSTKTEVLTLAREHPLLFRSAVEIEDHALRTGKTHTVKGLGRHWTWRDLPGLSPEALAALPDAPVEACTVCVVGY